MAPSLVIVGNDCDGADDDDWRRTSFLVDKVHERQPVRSVGEDVRLALERVADSTHVVEYDAGHGAQTHRIDWTIPANTRAITVMSAVTDQEFEFIMSPQKVYRA